MKKKLGFFVFITSFLVILCSCSSNVQSTATQDKILKYIDYVIDNLGSGLEGEIVIYENQTTPDASYSTEPTEESYIGNTQGSAEETNSYDLDFMMGTFYWEEDDWLNPRTWINITEDDNSIMIGIADAEFRSNYTISKSEFYESLDAYLSSNSEGDLFIGESTSTWAVNEYLYKSAEEAAISWSETLSFYYTKVENVLYDEKVGMIYYISDHDESGTPMCFYREYEGPYMPTDDPRLYDY